MSENTGSAGRARLGRVGFVALLVLIGALLAAPIAHATVSISRAELQGTDLRIEGTAIANRTITVDGVAMGSSDDKGRFKIQRSNFAAPPTCRVEVNDGSAQAVTATLSGCTVESPTSGELSSLVLDPTEVVGGQTAQGTVTLTAGAPSGGLVVALSSNNTAAATVPDSVTVAAGQSSATFTVSTNVVTNSQSSTIIATADGITRSSTITVLTDFAGSNGFVSINRGGNGHGRVTSDPPGIDCTIDADGGTGTCDVAFPAGTEVKLDARAASNSRFRGWDTNSTASCRDAPKVTVAAGTVHHCRPVFQLR